MYIFPITYGRITYLIIANAAIPGNPRKPAMTVVIALIGIRKSNDAPTAFNRNKSKAPIANLIKACPIKRTGFKGAPIIRNKTMTPTKMEMTITGSNE